MGVAFARCIDAHSHHSAGCHALVFGPTFWPLWHHPVMYKANSGYNDIATVFLLVPGYVLFQH